MREKSECQEHERHVQTEFISKENQTPKVLQMEGSSFQGPFHGPVSPAPVPSPTSQGIHLMGLSTLGDFQLP